MAFRDRGNRGMFGYEGEGFMRGGGDRPRGRDDDRDYDQISEFARGGGHEFLHGGGSFLGEERDRYGWPDRGDYARPMPDAGDDRGGAPRVSYRGRGPKGYQRSDDRIREDVCERLELDHYIDASDVEVQVSGATVTLTGNVDSRGAKRRAEDIAESVGGVRDVQNNLRVGRDPK
jgi:hypothetical protein